MGVEYPRTSLRSPRYHVLRHVPRMDPDEDDSDHNDYESRLNDIHEELADYNNDWASSNEDGWFYSDED